MSEKVSRIINDTSFGRFLKEFKHYVQKHPDAILIGQCAGDDERAEDEDGAKGCNQNKLRDYKTMLDWSKISGN